MCSNQTYHPSKGEQLVNNTLARTAEVIKNKYGLKPCGVGASMPGGPIRRLTLCFDTKNRYSKEALRNLLIQTALELLGQVNNNDDIQPFLIKQPFTINDVEIIIYNHDANGRILNDPEVSTARISQSRLTYRMIDPDDSFKYKNQFEESYEEAVKLTSTQE